MRVPTKNESMWYRMPLTQVMQELNVDPAQGLSKVEARARLKKYGPNILAVKKKSPAPIAWGRLYWLLIPIILLAAALLSLFYSGNFIVFLLFAFLAILSMLLGAYPEAKARSNGAWLERRPKDRVFVRRDRLIDEIDAASLVPGDIVILTLGNRVPADGRLYTTARLSIDETTLSGGSNAALKQSAPIQNGQARLAERSNMAFMNTTVIYGYGVMIVTNTGMNTETGHNVRLLHKREPAKKPVELASDIACRAIDFVTHITAIQAAH